MFTGFAYSAKLCICIFRMRWWWVFSDIFFGCSQAFELFVDASICCTIATYFFPGWAFLLQSPFFFVSSRFLFDAFLCVLRKILYGSVATLDWVNNIFKDSLRCTKQKWMHSERNRSLGEVNINLVAQQTNLLLFQCIIFYFSFKFRRALFGWCLSWGRMMEDDFVRKLS